MPTRRCWHARLAGQLVLLARPPSEVCMNDGVWGLGFREVLRVLEHCGVVVSFGLGVR